MFCACKEKDNKIVEPCDFHGKWLDGRVGLMTDALNKIHDLAGQMSNRFEPEKSHPNLGAIQAWVHMVLPCHMEGQSSSDRKETL